MFVHVICFAFILKPFKLESSAKIHFFMFLPNGFEVQPMQVLATLHKNLIITLTITLPFGNSSYFSNSQFFMHWSEWEIRQDLFFCPKTLWVLKPPTISPVQTQYISNMPAESMQPGDHWKTLRFHTHANYVHLCWKATALARRLSDSIRIFFWTGDSHCIPLLGLWGLPLQIPLCVYTAAVQYGVFLICSIKHIVYKSVCLLGFFQGSNYQVKYHSKNYFVYSCILMYEWEN